MNKIYAKNRKLLGKMTRVNTMRTKNLQSRVQKEKKKAVYQVYLPPFVIFVCKTLLYGLLDTAGK